MPVFTLPLSSATADVFAIRPGQTLQTLVQGQPDNPFVSINGNKVPLGANSGLQPGQNVSVSVSPGPNGPQIQVQPNIVPPSGAGQPTAELPQMLTGVLRAMGALTHAGEAPGLVPPGMPASPAALRHLLSLFTERGQTGRDLQTLATAVSKAAQAGVLPANVADDLAWLTGQIVASAEKDIPKALRQAGGDAGRSLEAKLAAALKKGGLEGLADALRQDLRAQLGRLLEDKGLQEFLKANGGLREFGEAAKNVMERVTGSDLQNIRGLSEPYVYFELPFGPDAPIRQAQIHIFGRDGGRHRIDPEHVQAVMDLSTTAMGDLWIALMVTPGHCMCTIKATSPEAVEAVEGSSRELVEALSGAGYGGAAVRVGLWDGNRVREAAALMRGMSGVDVKA
ncbi:MAG: hypothetical protein RBU21_09425 [FCB group bacterium]|jgi:hypothetical protein|nr:hypothetical protein [FCB group bacterium]